MMPVPKAKREVERAGKGKRLTLGERLIEGMREIAADARGEPTGVLRYTIPVGATADEILEITRAARKAKRAADRARKKVPPPAPLPADQLATIRRAVGATQQTFAEYLGVRPAVVREWEAGTRTPSVAVRRLLGDMAARPDHWRAQVSAAA